MKKLLYIFFLPIILFSACETESSDNGELDNMWYLVKVDSLESGQTVDYRNKRIMWSFQGPFVQINETSRFINYYMARFSKENGYMKISTPFVVNRTCGDDFLTEDRLDEVRPLGLNSLEESFLIETLNGDEMILRDDVLRLTFERY